MALGSEKANALSSGFVRISGNAAHNRFWQNGPMAEGTKSRGFVRQWMQLAGLKQADLVSKLDYSKAKAFAVWHGEQRLNEDILEEVADLLHVRPYELLMSPDTAHRLRRLEAAFQEFTHDDEAGGEAPTSVTRLRPIVKAAL